MVPGLSDDQLTGLNEAHLVTVTGGQRLQPAATLAFEALREDARAAGFDLAIASGFRAFTRQLAIWNGKARGERAVYDDAGQVVPMQDLAPEQQLHAILRYSAIPGTSRHHWGTDLDVYDAAAMPPGYRLQLSPAETADEGVFGALHRWLDQRIEAGESHGFHRPYGVDRGGVATERWHLSHAPLSQRCGERLSARLLLDCWERACPGDELALREPIERLLPEILERYVVVPPGWCPADR